MTVSVIWATNEPETIARGYWDQGMIEALLDGTLWGVPLPEFDHVEVPAGATLGIEPPGGAIVIVPARHNAAHVEWVNEIVAPLDWCLLILTGDEAGEFPYLSLKGPDRFQVWAMDAREGTPGVHRVLGSGWPPWFRDLLPDEPPAKEVDWSFAGQVTHVRREAMAEAFRPYAMDTVERARGQRNRGILVETTEFAGGLPQDEYVRLMSESKVVPCASGPESPDSFRLYEALEAGCVPIADNRTPHGEESSYWTWMVGPHAFPEISNWVAAPSVMEQVLEAWPENVARLHAWWQDWKRGLAYDFSRLMGAEVPLDGPEITVVITTSPTRKHPDTSDLDEVIASVRKQLPDSDVVVVCDGVRPEQEKLRDVYYEYVRRVCWNANRTGRVLPVVLDEWGHQANAMRAALDHVRTPLVLFVEHDTPIEGDVPWHVLAATIHSGRANVIRLSHEASILDVHQYLFLDSPKNPDMTATAQWSQRPHLARALWYREVLDRFFAPESRTMIEDVMHGIVQSAFFMYGEAGWEQWRIWLYTPPGDIKRTWHLDTRGDEPKYDMRFVYPGDDPPGAPKGMLA